MGVNNLEGQDNLCPEFTAEELNLLSRLSRKNIYYLKCKDFVDSFLRGSLLPRDMSDKQLKWLWGIKADLKEELRESA